MKKFINKIAFFSLLCALPTFSYAQEEFDEETEGQEIDLMENTNSAKFELGNGLNIQMNNGAYKFRIGGMTRMNYAYTDLQNPANHENTKLHIGAARLNIGGSALNEKVSFFMEADFVNAFALLEAWGAYHFNDNMKLTVGQKLGFTNDRSFGLNETHLSMVDRSLLSTTFTDNGREFGLFFESSFDLGSVTIMPAVSITSGDGMNSFGSSSIDPDKGGYKYGGRLDILPLGKFSTPNGHKTTVDFAREKSPKIAIGGAFSYNVGASHQTGDGHGELTYYDENGEVKNPNYAKIYADFLMKYNGFSLSADFANSFVHSEENIYTSAGATERFVGEAASAAYVLGMAYNVQLDYLFKGNWGVNVRYTEIMPEFENYESSILQEMESVSLGVAKYFKQDTFKIQVMGSYLNGKDTQGLVNDLPVIADYNERFEVKAVAQIIF